VVVTLPVNPAIGDVVRVNGAGNGRLDDRPETRGKR